MKTIKLIGNKKYEIGLHETEAGQFLIKYETEDVDASCGPFYDYKTAEFVFQELLQDLEGM